MWKFIKQYKSQFFVLLPILVLTFLGIYFLNERNISRAEERMGATSVLMPVQGGTGTSTIPTLGQILVGQSNGKYIPTSTITATTTFTSINANTLSLDSGVALSAGSFTASTTFDFKAGLNTGANAFRMQFYESLNSGIKNSGGYIQYDSDANYLEFGGIKIGTGEDVPGFRIARDTGIATFFGVNLPALVTIGGGSIEYTQDTALTLAGKTNSVNAARLNLWELAAGSGGFVKFDGSANQLNFGTQTDTSTETNAFSINRGSAIVNFNSSITTGKVIGGSAVGSSLSLQGTSGNGTLTSAGLKFLVGNNGGTTAMSILNNGNVGIGTTTPTGILTIRTNGTTDALKIFETDGSEILTVRENGNVGIGRTAPDYPLEVNGNISIYDTANTSKGLRLMRNGLPLGGMNTDSSQISFYATAGNGLRFTVSSSVNAMTILPSGNIGMGTTTPPAKLTVVGDIWATGVFTINSSTFLYDHPWKDENQAGVAMGQGATALDFIQVSSTNIYARCFNGGTTVDQMFWGSELQHDWYEGSAIKPHIHWMPEDNNSGDVTFSLDYFIAKNGGTSPAQLAGTLTKTVSTTGVAWLSTTTEFADLSLPNNKIGTQIMWRIYRTPTGLDTYGSHACLETAGYHYQLNSNGSRQIFSK